MKKFVVLLFLILGPGALAQTSMSFSITLDGSTAVPSNEWHFQGHYLPFSLDSGNLFSAGLNLALWNGATVSIYRSENVQTLGTHLYDFTPGGIVQPRGDDPGGRLFSLSQTLSSQEAFDVQSGLWWVNIANPTYPEGQFRGQIVSVPEPSVFALIVAGVASISILMSLKNRSLRPALRAI